MAINALKEPTGKITGLGTLTQIKDGYRVTIGSVSYDLNATEVPAGLSVPNGEYWLTLNAVGTKLWTVAPPNNKTVFGYFKGFSAKEGELPTPYMQPGGQRKGKDDRVFYAQPKPIFFPLIKITYPKQYAGLEVSTICDYLFKPYEADPTQMMIALKGKAGEHLVHTLQLFGLDFEKDEIKASENVLPQLEAMLVPRKKMLLVGVKDGRVDTLNEAPEDFLAMLTAQE